jgi:hypothetical protein
VRSRVRSIALVIALSYAELATSANRIPLELNKSLAPVLVANVNGVNVRLQCDLGNFVALVLQQAVLDSIHAAPTGEPAKFQGVDGVFEAQLYKVAMTLVRPSDKDSPRACDGTIVPSVAESQKWRGEPDIGEYRPRASDPVVEHWRTHVGSQQRVRQ